MQNDPSAKAPPFLFVVGGQKCGTTTLFKLFAESEGFAPCTVKEPHFLSQRHLTTIENFERYLELFERNDPRPRLDGSTSYLHSDSFIRTLKSRNIDAHFLVITRDPAGRCLSGYAQAIKKEPRREWRPFEQIVEQMSQIRNGHPEAIRQREEELLRNAITNGLVCEENYRCNHFRRFGYSSIDADFDDPYWSLRYFSLSLVADRVKRLRREFPGRVSLFDFSDFIANPIAIVEAVAHRMNVEVETASLVAERRNESKIPRSMLSRFLLRQSDRTRGTPLEVVKRKLLIPSFKNVITRAITADAQRLTMTDECQAALRSLFRREAQALAELHNQ